MNKKIRPTYKELLEINLKKYDPITRLERKALKKHQDKDSVYLKAVGTKQMITFAERGWTIMTHSPSNYAHAANIYLMRIDRTILEERLA